MRFFRLTAALAAAALTLLAPALAADVSRIGPQSAAADLLAARPALREPGFELVYKVEGGTAPGTMTIDLAADFVAVRRGASTQIYDYALRRIIGIGEHGFTNGSLYAFVDFSVAETYNRRYLRGVIASAHIQDPSKSNEIFWAQSELHVMDPKDGVPSIDRRVAGDGSVHFSFDGIEAASYTPSAQALLADQAAMFARFLRMNASIHPSVIAEIAAGRLVPQRLSFMLPPMMKKPDAVWTLQSAGPAQIDYPLPAGTTPLLRDPSADSSPLDDLLPVMLSAVARRAPGLRRAADYRAAIEKALADGKPFQAAVTSFELMEQYGQSALDCPSAENCHTLQEIFTVASAADPRAAVLLAALSPKKDEMDRAIELLRDMKRDDLDNPYVLDEFLANNLVSAGRTDDALPYFAKAIRGNPYLGGYYKDLGDLFRESYEPELAWICYDLGRQLPGGPDAPVIDGMTRYESGMAAQYPEFF